MSDSKDKLTEISPLPDQLLKRIDCRLIHSKIPYYTGVKIWSPSLEKYVDEILYVCKEGCKFENG